MGTKTRKCDAEWCRIHGVPEGGCFTAWRTYNGGLSECRVPTVYEVTAIGHTAILHREIYKSGRVGKERCSHYMVRDHIMRPGEWRVDPQTAMAGSGPSTIPETTNP